MTGRWLAGWLVTVLAWSLAVHFVAAIAGCGPNTATNVKTVAVDVGQCAFGKVPPDLLPLLGDLQNAVTGTADAWGNATSVAITAGVDVAECLFAALVHFVSNPPAAAPGAMKARLEMGTPWRVLVDDRLAVFKTQIGTKKAAGGATVLRQARAAYDAR